MYSASLPNLPDEAVAMAKSIRDWDLVILSRN